MTDEEKAEEYADKRIGKVLENSTFPNSYWHRQDWENYKQAFLAGYKAKTDEINKIGLALQSDMDKTIEQNIALKKELNKANEWHYIKDGNLPKENENVLIYSNRANHIGFYRNGFWFTNSDGCLEEDDIEVIAWKEIVLPKEIKEND